MHNESVRRLLLGYYLATLLFVALDVGLQINVRLAFLDAAPGWRTAYYAVCLAFAAAIQWRPDLSTFIGAVEGLVTMVSLILSVAPRAMMLGDNLGRPLDLETMVNFLISGFFAYVSWWRGMAALRRRFR
ncbi:MAG: hypothetical protein AAGA41_06730 [Pseudomonadota bacterium]